jgi:hypothetical protein
MLENAVVLIDFANSHHQKDILYTLQHKVQEFNNIYT